MKKNEQYEKENNNLKKKLEELKQYIKRGYSTFILEEEKEEKKEEEKEEKKEEKKLELNLGDILNINDEINKKENELLKNNKESSNNDNKFDNYEDKYKKTDSNFYLRKRLIEAVNNKNNNKTINNNKDNQSQKNLFIKKKELNTEVKLPPILSDRLKKIPSLSNLSIVDKNYIEYRKRVVFNNK